MMLAYFDDSSDSRRERFYACGGIIGHESYWEAFEPLWMDATASLSEPFRSSDCETQHGQFSNWEKKDCDALMAKLVGVICRFPRLGGFASVVPIPDFRAIFKKAGEYDPYFLAVTHTLLNMAHLGSIYHQNVKCWFEENPATNARCIQIYQDLAAIKSWKKGHNLMGVNIASKQLVPLQAADLIAREALKMWINLGKRPTRKPAERLWQQFAFLGWTRDELKEFNDHGGLDNLQSLVDWLPGSMYAKHRPFKDPTLK